MAGAPHVFTWDGDNMVPIAHHRARCNDVFVVGERYRVEVIEESSVASRNHYFAALHDAWLNLPDDIATQFPTDEHLRKAALVATGHFDERRFVAASPLEARKLAAFMRPVDEFAVYSIAENVLIERKPKSQKRKAMGGPTFQRSKSDVLEYVAGLIGVTPDQLSANAARAA